jgi:hypothetical protein
MSLIPQNSSISVKGTTVKRDSGNKSSQNPTNNVSSSNTTAPSSSSNQDSADQFAFSTWGPTIKSNATAEKLNQYIDPKWRELNNNTKNGGIQAQGSQDLWKYLGSVVPSIMSGVEKLGQALAQAKQKGGGGGEGNGRSEAPEQNQQRESSIANRHRLDLFGHG